jgi:hypothetical protein
MTFKCNRPVRQAGTSIRRRFLHVYHGLEQNIRRIDDVDFIYTSNAFSISVFQYKNQTIQLLVSIGIDIA